ncbi:hypothetical protein D3C73_823740 [compost metagenome]
MIVHLRQSLERLSGGFVVTQNGHQLAGRGRAGTVEQCEIAILVAEEAQGRIHPVDRRNELLGYVMTEVYIGLSKRQKIDEDIEDCARTTRNMSSIDKNLAIELAVEKHCLPLYPSDERR